MNEEHSSQSNTPINSELEARLLAMLHGEASDFERDQLESLIAERPDVAVAFEELQRLHNLLSEVGTGEAAPITSEQDLNWKLPSKRRDHLISVLSGSERPEAFHRSGDPQLISRPKWFKLPSSKSIAVFVTVAGLAAIAVGLLLPSVQMSREAARRFRAQNSVLASELKDRISLSESQEAPTAATAAFEEFKSTASAEYDVELGTQAQPHSAVDSALTELKQSLASDYIDESQVEETMRAKDQLSDLAWAGRLGEPSQPQASGWELRNANSAFRDSVAGSKPNSLPAEPGAAGGGGYGGMGGGMGGEQALGGSISEVRKLQSDFGNRTPETVLEQYSRSTGDLPGNAPSPPPALALPIFPKLGRSGAVADGPENRPAITRGSNLARSDAGVHSDDADMDMDGFSDVTLGKDSLGGIVARPDPGSLALAGSSLEGMEQAAANADKLATPRILLADDTPTSERVSSFALTDEMLGQQAVPKSSDAADDARQAIGKRELPQNYGKEAATRWEALGQARYGRTQSQSSELETLEESELKEKLAILADGENAEQKQSEVVFQATPERRAEPRRKRPVEIEEVSAAETPFSTFSLHVSDVSFKLAWAALSQGKWPEAEKIRIEEFVNALDYHDPLPTAEERVACQLEQAIHPFALQRNLLRISMRTAATGRAINTPLHLTLLVDNSGSMERPDRQASLRRAFTALLEQLTSADRVTLISFANQPRLLADRVVGTQTQQLEQIIETLPSEGGTNIEAALQLAMEKSLENSSDSTPTEKRIILLTDGAVNLGDADPESLATLVTEMRDAGIAFDAAGISAHDLNDEVLEALTRQGDGRYYLLGAAENATQRFADQIAGALRPSAKNVKVQIEFNPQRVGKYKLLGFEKHRLNKEDFRNDQVDAAEMAATEAGVAVYQFEPKPDGVGNVGTVSVRFLDLSTNSMIERTWPIPYESHPPRVEQANASMRIAAVAAIFAAKLRGAPVASTASLKDLAQLLSTLPSTEAKQTRVQQLQRMLEMSRQLDVAP